MLLLQHHLSCNMIRARGKKMLPSQSKSNSRKDECKKKKSSVSENDCTNFHRSGVISVNTHLGAQGHHKHWTNMVILSQLGQFLFMVSCSLVIKAKHISKLHTPDRFDDFMPLNWHSTFLYLRLKPLSSSYLVLCAIMLCYLFAKTNLPSHNSGTKERRVAIKFFKLGAIKCPNKKIHNFYAALPTISSYQGEHINH